MTGRFRPAPKWTHRLMGATAIIPQAFEQDWLVTIRRLVFSDNRASALSWRLQANALIEQGFELTSDISPVKRHPVS